VFLLGKAKFLLLGMTKLPTLLSAVAAFGVYWTVWGWKFALGLVASMYVHDMGHVFALRRYGIRATAPMFVPGLGAFVCMEQYPKSQREDARVGLAGSDVGTVRGGGDSPRRGGDALARMGRHRALRGLAQSVRPAPPGLPRRRPRIPVAHPRTALHGGVGARSLVVSERRIDAGPPLPGCDGFYVHRQAGKGNSFQTEPAQASGAERGRSSTPLVARAGAR
jgi:hypothetical protein